MSVYIDDIVKILIQPVNAGVAVGGYDSNNTTGAAISGLGILEALASTAYKNSVPGTVISITSLGNNIAEAKLELDKNGKISDSRMLALASDLESLAGGGGLALAVALGGVTIEVAGVIAALSMIAATGLAIASAMQGDSTDISDAWGDIFDAIPSATDNINGGINDALNTANQPLTPDIDGINDIIGDAAKDLGEILGDALKSIPDGEDIEDLLKDLGGMLNDLLDKLPDDLVPDFLDGLLGGLDDIFPNGLLPYLLDLFPVDLDPFINAPWREAMYLDWWISPLVLDLDGDGVETVGITSDKQVLFDHDGDGVKTATGWVGKDDGLLAA